MTQQQHGDQDTIAEINERSGAGLELLGRATAGKLGGALPVRRSDGRPAVVTVFGGDATAAARVAASVNGLAAHGLPVPRHDWWSTWVSASCWSRNASRRRRRGD